jgi:hypothetical protein
LDDQPDTVPAIVTQTGTSYAATLAEGISYLHVRGQDKAGNWGPASHYRVLSAYTFTCRSAYGLTCRSA